MVKIRHTKCVWHFQCPWTKGLEGNSWNFLLGNCDKFDFTFKFEVRMWVWIYQIFERDQIPICHLLNKSKLNSDKRWAWKGFHETFCHHLTIIKWSSYNHLAIVLWSSYNNLMIVYNHLIIFWSFYHILGSYYINLIIKISSLYDYLTIVFQSSYDHHTVILWSSYSHLMIII